jgi:hypothetical protein
MLVGCGKEEIQYDYCEVSINGKSEIYEMEVVDITTFVSWGSVYKIKIINTNTEKIITTVSHDISVSCYS